MTKLGRPVLSRNATVDSRTNTTPKPKPWATLITTISVTPVWSVHPVM